MNFKEYAESKGVTISLAVVARIEGKPYISLKKMHEQKRFKELDHILVSAESKFRSICKK